MAEVEIRTAGADDIAGYVALYSAVASEGRWIGGEAPVDEDRVAATADNARTSPGTTLLVAVTAGTTVGAIFLGLARGVVGLGMMIDADHRGKGIGRDLLEAGIEWARSVGAHKMTLEVWPHNGPAIALYLHSGFVIEGRLRRHHRRRSGELWDSIAMGLVLDDSSPGSPDEDDATLPEEWRR